MLMVQLFIIILSVRRIDVEECARTAARFGVGRPLPNSAVPHARTTPSSG